VLRRRHQSGRAVGQPTLTSAPALIKERVISAWS
jgi:hypothetical protein